MEVGKEKEQLCHMIIDPRCQTGGRAVRPDYHAKLYPSCEDASQKLQLKTKWLKLSTKNCTVVTEKLHSCNPETTVVSSCSEVAINLTKEVVSVHLLVVIRSGRMSAGWKNGVVVSKNPASNHKL